MLFIKNFFQHFYIFLTPFIAAAIAQVIKISIKQKGQKLKINDFLRFTYSGMPSGHSALMLAATTIIGLTQGFRSPLFAFAGMITILIINDAIRLRNYIGQHGEILNELVKDLKDDNYLDNKYPHLKENIGHTPIQVLMGGLLGIFVATVIYFIMR
ncbi:MAG: divergent PAP2 family protein [Candidatus Falkowbacteria bacterium]